MKIIRTLTGDKPANSFGAVYFHDHLITGNLLNPDPSNDMIVNDPDIMTEELKLFKAVGGTLLGEASVIDFGANSVIKKKISEASGVDVVATVGFGQKENEPEEVKKSTEDALYERVVNAVKNGYGPENLKPGQLKLGTSYNFISDSEMRCARAVARAQKETDLPLFCHTGIGTMGLEQVELLRSCGANLEHCCIGHMDRNPDLWLYKQILKNGVYIGLDQISKVKYATEEIRVGLIIGLVKAGYRKRILISGDMARKTYFTAYGGGPGFKYILETFIPRLKQQLKEEGYPHREIESIIEDITINNPREYFSIEA